MDDEFDIAREEMYARLADELYPEHKEQAVQEFAVDRLRSYYLANPNVGAGLPATGMNQHLLRNALTNYNFVVPSKTGIQLNQLPGPRSEPPG